MRQERRREGIGAAMGSVKNVSATLICLALLTPHLVSARDAPLIERVTSCDATVAVQAADEMLKSNANWREPIAMLVAADTLFRNGRKDDGVFWYYAATLRSQYQMAFERGDRGQAAITIGKAVTPSLTVYAYSDAGKLRSTLTRVLAWDKATPNTLRNLPQSPHEKALVTAAYKSIRDVQRQLATQGKALEQRARVEAPNITVRNTAHCKHDDPDPLLAELDRVFESRQVEDFARRDPTITRAVGAVRSAGAIASLGGDADHRPTRYTVKVLGKRALFADVDVHRSKSGTQLQVSCVTRKYAVGDLKRQCETPAAAAATAAR
jgi:hypothetical protein